MVRRGDADAMARDLRVLVGSEHVHEPAHDSPYNSDCSRRRGVEGRADVVVLPGSAEEVAAVLAWCYANDVPLVARGGGTGLTGVRSRPRAASCARSSGCA